MAIIEIPEPSLIEIGAAPNDGTGDPIRVAMSKINTNFVSLDGGVRRVLDALSFSPKEITSFYVAGGKTLYERGEIPGSFSLYWAYEGMTRPDVQSITRVIVQYIEEKSGLPVFSRDQGLEDRLSLVVESDLINDTGEFVLEVHEISPENYTFKTTARLQISFFNQIYWGSDLSSDISPDRVLVAFGQSENQHVLSNEKSRTITYYNVDGEYIYYIYPDELGLLSHVKVNGMIFSGYTIETMYINGVKYLSYRFDYPQYGEQILVEWV